MKPSDISEIKKLYQDNLEKCGIDRISGCYVNGDKHIVTKFSQTFMLLPDEEQYKYLELFRKVLSGTRDKNLLLLEPRRVHGSADMRCDEVKLLQSLIDTELKDEAVTDEFYQKVVENFSYLDNYLILIAHQNYDVPGKTQDGIDMDDASEEVFRHILCAICPVKLSKPGLGYVATERQFRNLVLGRIVELPMNGFLYPAFIDRSADVDRVIYYTKDTVDIRPGFADAVLGSGTPLGAADQKENFSSLISDTLGEDGDLTTILGIQDSLRTLVAEKKVEEESPVLDKKELGKLLRTNGLDETKVKAMEELFDDAFRRSAADDDNLIGNDSAEDAAVEDSFSADNTQENVPARVKYPEDVPVEERIFVASNLMSGRQLEVKNQDFSIKIKTSRTDLLETKIVDGMKCLVIHLEEGVTVNGIPVQF